MNTDHLALVRLLAPLLEETVEIDEETLRRAVAQRLRWVLDNHFGRLAALLYRFDVEEHRVEQAFASTPDGRLHEVLADLVLERARQKLRTRAQRDPR